MYIKGGQKKTYTPFSQLQHAIASVFVSINLFVFRTDYDGS